MDSADSLPQGVVTFLLTDIEGSTRLWEREPDAMRAALVRHDTIVHECVPRLHGRVIKSKGEGDSAFAVFSRVGDAVSAALALQCAFASERWVTSAPIRVRMAVHTGPVDLRDGDYYGPTVNRCARLRALAKGGQILLSDVTAQLTQHDLPDGANVRDLGTHQLKDLIAPERVWQLNHPGTEFTQPAPAPRSRPTAMPIRRAYKLTDEWNRSPDGREWGPAVKHKAKLAVGPGDAKILCYTTPSLALLLNPQYERYALPRVWEALVDVEPMRGDAIVACQEVATTRQVTPPALTGVHHARFAVLCAQAAYNEARFGAWAHAWLTGQDTSSDAAFAVARELDSEPARPESAMAANAARSAGHASSGDSRAIELAAEAIRAALRLTRLDLPALAQQAVRAA